MSSVPDPQRRAEAACRTGLPAASDINLCRPFRPSEYLEPASVEEATRLLDQHGAVQCGYCSPGMILSAKALLDRNPHPCEAEVKSALSGNICRCTGYQQIVEAVLAVADQGAPEREK